MVTNVKMLLVLSFRRIPARSDDHQRDRGILSRRITRTILNRLRASATAVQMHQAETVMPLNHRPKTTWQ